MVAWAIGSPAASPLSPWTGRNRVSSSRDRLQRESVFRTAQERYAANRDKDASASWKTWLRERYARQWYFIGCLVLDVAVVATLLQNGMPPPEWWQYVLAVLAVAGLTYAEFKGLRRWWPTENVKPLK